MNVSDVKSVNEGSVRTSYDWLRLLYPKTVILDFDGFDRQDLQYSFYQELVSKEEFENRLAESTILHRSDYLKNDD
jgi:hypothetical protein